MKLNIFIFILAVNFNASDQYDCSHHAYCKEFSFQHNTHKCVKFEKVLHVHPGYEPNNFSCEATWDSNIGRYVLDPVVHYVHVDKSSSKVGRKNKEIFWKSYIPRNRSYSHDNQFLTTDILIDVRCNFYWPHVYFHKFADCLLGIIPSLHSFLTKNSDIMIGKSAYLLVDNSTSFLCDKEIYEASNCFFSELKQLIFQNYSNIRCVNTISPDHWRTISIPIIITKELICLQTQKEPFIFDNTICLQEFRTLYLHEYCKYCIDQRKKPQDLKYSSNTLIYGNHFQTSNRSILVIKRPTSAARNILQHDQLLVMLHELFPYSPIEVFHGYEPLCDVIRMFHSARVIIGAHGSALINTLFSRPDTLLIEITFSRVDGKPGHWRSNIYKAVEIGLVCHVFLVPPGPHATDRDLQLRKHISLSKENLTTICNMAKEFTEMDISWGISEQRMRNSQYFYDHFLTNGFYT